MAPMASREPQLPAGLPKTFLPVKNIYSPPEWIGRAQTNFRLSVINRKEEHEGHVSFLAHVPYVIFGRDPCAAHVFVGHPSVSRQHAVLEWDGRDGRCLLTDLGSAEGTFVDGLQLVVGEPRQIFLGSRIRFGRSNRLYILEPDPASPDTSNHYIHLPPSQRRPHRPVHPPPRHHSRPPPLSPPSPPAPPPPPPPLPISPPPRNSLREPPSGARSPSFSRYPMPQSRSVPTSPPRSAHSVSPYRPPGGPEHHSNSRRPHGGGDMPPRSYSEGFRGGDGERSRDNGWDGSPTGRRDSRGWEKPNRWEEGGQNRRNRGSGERFDPPGERKRRKLGDDFAMKDHRESRRRMDGYDSDRDYQYRKGGERASPGSKRRNERRYSGSYRYNERNGDYDRTAPERDGGHHGFQDLEGDYTDKKRHGYGKHGWQRKRGRGRGRPERG